MRHDVEWNSATRWPLVCRTSWHEGGVEWTAGLWAQGTGGGVGVLTVKRAGHEIGRVIGVSLGMPAAGLSRLVRQEVEAWQESKREREKD